MAQQFGIAPKQLNSLIYTGPDIALVPITEAARNPTITDVKYPIDCLWRNTVSRTLYWLSGFSSGQALWVPLTGGTGGLLNTLSDTIGNVVNALAGNIQLASTTTTLVIAKDVGDFKINFSLSNVVIGGVITTVGAVTGDAITFDMGSTPGTYQINCRVSAFCSAANGGPLSAGYELIGVLRTTGAAGVVIGTIDKVVNEEAGITAGDANIIASGNNLIVRVLGTAAKTINWKAELTYTFVS